MYKTEIVKVSSTGQFELNIYQYSKRVFTATRATFARAREAQLSFLVTGPMSVKGKRSDGEVVVEDVFELASLC